MSLPELVKVFPNKSDESFAICPKCGHANRIKVSKYRHGKNVSTLFTCRCGHVFTIFVEYRKYYRKEVAFWGACINSDNQETEIEVINLSRSGVCFILSSPIKASEGERLYISFMLKDKKKEVVTKNVMVRRIDDKIIGAEFEPHIDEKDKALSLLLDI